MKAGTKVRVLRGTWAGQEGVVLPFDDGSPFQLAMHLINAVEVKLESGETVQLPKNNLKPI